MQHGVHPIVTHLGINFPLQVSQWKIDSKMRNYWMDAMLHALDTVPLEEEPRILLMQYFSQAANAMINHE